MNISVEGAHVVITGATGIVGRRLTLSFAREGANLYLIGRDNTTDLVDAARKAGAQDATYASVDLSDDNQIIELFAAIEQHWGRVDVLINNAGLYPLNPLLSMTVDDWDDVMAVNLRAPFLMTREAAKLMIRTRLSGSIINITSGAALRAKVGHGHYSTSKAGLEMLTKSFALELAPFNIRVNAVAPGFAPGSAESQLPDNYVRKMAETIPLGRVSGEMDAPAVVLFLVSPYAAFITGATITVDGGRIAGILGRDDRERMLSMFTPEED
jgi:3-oxoacyl-[acyl-carrier protein] reductase